MPTIGVAVAIPEPWASQLQDYRASIGDTTAEMIPTHITLVPPTRSSSDLAEVEPHLDEVAAGHDAFVVHLRGTGTFRPVSPGRLRDRWPRASPSASSSPPAYAAARSPSSSTFPFHPHVTIAHHLEDPSSTGPSRSSRPSSAPSTSTDFHLYVHDDEVGWQPDRSFALRPVPAVT